MVVIDFPSSRSANAGVEVLLNKPQLEPPRPDQNKVENLIADAKTSRSPVDYVLQTRILLEEVKADLPAERYEENRSVILAAGLALIMPVVPDSRDLATK